MSNIKIKGIVPALISPVNEDGSIRVISLRRIIEWQLTFSICGLYIGGSTGECLLMKPERRMELLEIVIDQVNGRIPVIAHIGALDQSSAISLARHAEQCGADLISSIPPAYYEYREAEIINYYAALANSTSLPLITYGIGLTNNNLNARIMEKLMKIDNIIGIKWTYQNYFEMQRIKKINNGDINVINGPDESLISGLAMGADAGIGSTYNIMPGLFMELYQSFQKSNMDTARQLQYTINRVIELLLQYGVINSIKEIYNMLGFDVGYCVPPIRRLNAEERSMLLDAVSFLDFEKQGLRID